MVVAAISIMASRKQPFEPASSNAKKRKSSGGNDANYPKRPHCGTDKTGSVAKAAEERRGVLQCVRNETNHANGPGL